MQHHDAFSLQIEGDATLYLLSICPQRILLHFYIHLLHFPTRLASFPSKKMHHFPNKRTED